MQNNFLFESLPLVVFFLTYYFTKNLYMATATCIVISWVNLLICKIKFKKISKNIWISTLLITLLGGLTILLHNKTFVMLKPTALFWILGFSLLISQLMGKNGIKLMLQKEIYLPDRVWNIFGLLWSIFFILMGFINLFVAFNFSEYVWVKYKVFGSLTLTICFTFLTAIAAIILQKRYKKNNE